MGTDGYWTYCGDHFIMYINVKSLCSTPEINIILYFNYTLINLLKTYAKHILQCQGHNQGSIYLEYEKTNLPLGGVNKIKMRSHIQKLRIALGNGKTSINVI